MPKLQVLSKKTESEKKPRLIFVGDGKPSQAVSQFAQKHGLEFKVYNDSEWATLEEIDQYIQEEEVSKQIIDLPLGGNAAFSLNSAADQNVKRISQLKKLSVKEAARALKIGRATLYRKLEKNSSRLKKKLKPSKKLKSAA